MRRNVAVGGALGLGLMLACGCGGGAARPASGAKAASAPSAGPGTAAREAPPGCERLHAAATAPTPLAGAQQGATVALARHRGRTLAFVADEDEQAVVIVDVDARRQLSSTPVDGRPGQLMFAQDGRLLVTLRDASKVLVLDPGETVDAPLDRRCTVDAPAEPVGLAMTPDGATVVVTSAWGRALTAYAATTMEPRFQVALPREPRAVVVSGDGARAIVSHAVGAQASVVELAGDHKARPISLRGKREGSVKLAKVRAMMRKMAGPGHAPPDEGEEESALASCQGFALAKTDAPGGRVLAPQVVVDPGDPSQRTAGYGDENSPTETPDVAVIDDGSGSAFASSLEVTRDVLGDGDPRDKLHQECLLPRAAAVDPKTHTLLVACFGIDAVVAFDALAASPIRTEKQRWSVAAGPNGIAVDAANSRAVVWSQFDRTLGMIPLDADPLADTKGKAPAPVARIELTATPARKVSVAAALGRLLFHASGDARVARDGRACASCHPDGRDDALTWATPEGPRRTIMLAGRVQPSGPYSWSLTEHSLKEHLSTTFDRLHGAGGLKSVELDALAAYIQSLPTPPKSDGLDARKVQRGAAIFASKDAGCASCHSNTGLTDGQPHDVRSKTAADRGPQFNTPSLRFVGGTGPYFHDGRYGTLRDVLTGNDDRMGRTKHLSADDLDALETYLRSL